MTRLSQSNLLMVKAQWWSSTMVTCIGCISTTLAFGIYLLHISFSGTAYEGLTGSRPETHYNLGDLGLVPSTARTEFERSRASSRKTVGKVCLSLRLRFFHAKFHKKSMKKSQNNPVVNIIIKAPHKEPPTWHGRAWSGMWPLTDALRLFCWVNGMTWCQNKLKDSILSWMWSWLKH